MADEFPSVAQPLTPPRGNRGRLVACGEQNLPRDFPERNETFQNAHFGTGAGHSIDDAGGFVLPHGVASLFADGLDALRDLPSVIGALSMLVHTPLQPGGAEPGGNGRIVSGTGGR